MFDNDTVYSAEQVVERGIGNYSTLAKWRMVPARGPAFIKLGKRIGYRGADLNRWLDEQTVRPTAA